MSTRLAIPLVSTNAADVTLVHWKVRPGETVAHGQSLLDVTTDKAAFEIESPADGTLLSILAPERSVVPIGYVVALIGNPGEEDAHIERDNAALVAAQQHSLVGREPEVGCTGPTPPTNVAPAFPGTNVRATPKARRLAEERGLDLAAIQAETGASIITETVLQPYLA